MKIAYKTVGTCSSEILVEEENGIITGVRFFGGCNGNLQGISKLVVGRKIEEVIERINGIRCGNKPTSCPDQLCRALEQLQREKAAAQA
jgi:uncharacterized protein (TIGR03905 family)